MSVATETPAAGFSVHRTAGSMNVSSLLLALCCAFLIPNTMLTRNGSPDDHSIFAYIGWPTNRGFAPYRDVWDHKGPLPYYTNDLSWKLTPRTTVCIVPQLHQVLSIYPEAAFGDSCVYLRRDLLPRLKSSELAGGN